MLEIFLTVRKRPRTCSKTEIQILFFFFLCILLLYILLLVEVKEDEGMLVGHHLIWDKFTKWSSVGLDGSLQYYLGFQLSQLYTSVGSRQTTAPEKYLQIILHSLQCSSEAQKDTLLYYANMAFLHSSP